MIVVDTNIIAYLLIVGENTGAAKQLVQKDPDWSAPILWRSEFRNVITTYVRNKYFNLSQALFIINKAEELMLNGEYQIKSKDVIILSSESGFSAYDCEYVALAKDTDLNLITTDKKLIKAFPQIAYNLKEIVKN